MCGLFGWQFSEASNISNSKRAIIASILTLEMDKRGGDSFGIFADEKLERGLGLATYGIKPSGLARHKQLLAHTRKATTGQIKIENAHPFEIGFIVGAHNGIVHNHVELNKKHERRFDVDSMHIFAHLDEGKPLSDVESYGAITYVCKIEPEHVHLGRFYDGELAIFGLGTYPEPEAVLWASTPGTLDRATALAEVSSFRYDVKQGVLYRATGGKLYGSEQKLDFAEPFNRLDWRDFPTSTCHYSRHAQRRPSVPIYDLCEICEDQVAEHIDGAQGVLLCSECAAGWGYFSDEESLRELSTGA